MAARLAPSRLRCSGALEHLASALADRGEATTDLTALRARATALKDDLEVVATAA